MLVHFNFYLSKGLLLFNLPAQPIVLICNSGERIELVGVLARGNQVFQFPQVRQGHHEHFLSTGAHGGEERYMACRCCSPEGAAAAAQPLPKRIRWISPWSRCLRCIVPARRRSFMPRDKGGIGWTGKKAKKRAEDRRAAEEGASSIGPSTLPSPAAAGAAAANDNELEEAAATLARADINSESEEDVSEKEPKEAAVEGGRRPSDVTAEVDVSFSEFLPRSLPAAPEPEPPTGVVRRLKGSVLAEDAVQAARGCEIAQTWLREGDAPIFVQPGWEAYNAEQRREHQRHRSATYLAALAAIKECFPMKVCCNYFEFGGCTHGIPCECGSTQAPWPWIVHHPAADIFCDCHLSTRHE